MEEEEEILSRVKELVTAPEIKARSSGPVLLYFGRLFSQRLSWTVCSWTVYSDLVVNNIKSYLD